jgi:hypothetical protein
MMSMVKEGSRNRKRMGGERRGRGAWENGEEKNGRIGELRGEYRGWMEN